MTGNGDTGALADDTVPRHGRSYWEPRFQRQVVMILPGGYHVTSDDTMISTILGSCIAACVRDPVTGIGGMNHFLLPEDSRRVEHRDRWIDTYNHAATRYGTAAMEIIINEIIKRGGTRNKLEAKIFGGGRVTKAGPEIGERNISFVREYLQTEGIPILSEDTGGIWARKVYFSPASAEVYVKKVSPQFIEDIASQEKDYLSKIKDQPASGPVIFMKD